MPGQWWHDALLSEFHSPNIIFPLPNSFGLSGPAPEYPGFAAPIAPVPLAATQCSGAIGYLGHGRVIEERVGWVELFAIPINHEERVVMGFASGTGPMGRTRWLYPSFVPTMIVSGHTPPCGLKGNRCPRH
jgi:hypothetical protein